MKGKVHLYWADHAGAPWPWPYANFACGPSRCFGRGVRFTTELSDVTCKRCLSVEKAMRERREKHGMPTLKPTRGEEGR